MKRGCPRHPKVADLALRLGIPKYSAVGLLEMLWHFAAEFSPRGDIGRHSDAVIAESIEWSGDPEILLAALIETHWVDPVELPDRLVLHDWHNHCDDYTKKKVKGLGVEFASLQKILDNSRKVSPALPSHALPEPSPAKPVARSRSAQDCMPPMYITNEYGRRDPNPVYKQVMDALRTSREKIEKAGDPVAYTKAIIERASHG